VHSANTSSACAGGPLKRSGGKPHCDSVTDAGLNITHGRREFGSPLAGTIRPHCARPTHEITLYDGNGALSRPLLYASGRRATWMQLHAAVTEQASIPYSLENLATDLEIVKKALNGPAQTYPAAC
jgi:hypothetical protein